MTKKILEQRPMNRREDSVSRLDIYEDEYGHKKCHVVNDSRTLADYLNDWRIAREVAQYGSSY